MKDSRTDDFVAVEGWMYCGLSPDGHGGLGVFWRSPDNPATPAEYHLCGSCRPVFQRVDSNGAPIHDLMLDQLDGRAPW